MTPLEFEIPGLPRMTNTLRVHWRVKHVEAKRWKGLVANAVLLARKGTAIEFKRPMLTLTRFSSRESDYDGLVSSFKHVIDGLKIAGVIIDDKPSVIGQPNYLWAYARPKKGKIKVRVEERVEEI